MTVTARAPRDLLGLRARPRGTDHIRLADRYELFLGGRWEAPADGVYVPTTNPATEEPLAEVARGGRRRRRPRRRRRARRPARLARAPALERGKYVFRIARLIQERARELAIVETLDGGKPIRESRDVDVPPPRRTSSPTRAGRTSSPTPSAAARSSRWASSARSCRGTSRC